MDPNEILEAVAAAIADLRKEHAAEIAALKADLYTRTQGLVTEEALTVTLAGVAERADQFATRQDLDAEAALVKEYAQAVEAHVDQALQSTQEAIADARGWARETFATLSAVAALDEGVTLRAGALETALGGLSQHVAEVEAPVAALGEMTRHVLESRVTADQATALVERALAPLQTAQEALEATLATKATHEIIEAALTPLREALDAVDHAVMERVNDVQLDAVITPLQEAVSGLREQVGECVLKTQRSRDLDGLGEIIKTKASAEAVKDLADQTAHLFEAHKAAVLTLGEEVAALATPAQVEAAVAPVEAAAANTEALLRTVQARLDAQSDLMLTKATPADIQAAFERAVATVREDLLERYHGAEAWAKGGAGYQAFALVKHRGGLWQSTTRTHEEPAPDALDWMLLTDAIETAAFERREPGYLTLSTKYLSGASTDLRIREPIPVFRGVFDPKADYLAWDTVAKDSHVFLCLVDAPTQGPGEIVGEWQVFSGPRGRKGQSAAEVSERAIVDQVLAEVIPQLQRVVDTMEKAQ